MRPNFRDRSHPLGRTFSYHSKPCYYDEAGSQGNLVGANFKCSYSDYCKDKIASLDNLYDVYGFWIKVTLAEPSSSIIVRSEHQFSGNDNARLSLRKHFHEVLTGDPSRCGTYCHDLDSKQAELLGDYLGFIDLRLEFRESPIALAVLVPPHSLRVDRRTTLILGQYGPIFGAHAFPSTVYSMQDPSYGGAACAQACIIMALGLLSDRGAKIVGSFTLTSLAGALEQPWAADQALSSDCIAAQIGYTPLHAFPVSGLTFSQCCHLLNDCGVSASGLHLPERTISDEHMVLRLIEAYVLARYPVMMLVNSTTWYAEAIKDGKIRQEEMDFGHAVMIIGIQDDIASEDAALVIHDPGSIPFDIRLTRDCLKSAWDYPVFYGDERSTETNAFFVFIAEDCITRHAQDCMWCMWYKSDDDDYMPFRSCLQEGNYRIVLVHSKDICKKYILDGSDLNNALPQAFYWCIDAKVSEVKRVVWICSAQPKDPDEPWKRRLTFVPNQPVRVDLP